MKAWLILIVMAVCAYGIGLAFEVKPAYVLDSTPITQREYQRQLDSIGVKLSPAEQETIYRKW